LFLAVHDNTRSGPLHDWFFGHRSKLIDWLQIDSWIDSSLAATWETFKDRWNRASSFFASFRLTGWKRLLNGAFSEGLTLGVCGLAALYAIALPAFDEFDEHRLSTGEYSVKFLDRNGAEIGQRGILHNDAVPLEEIPDHLIKATLATEDRRFYEHFGLDVIGMARALSENVRANGVVQGGSTLTQQLAKNLFLSSERSMRRKIKEAFLALLLEARFTKREILKLYLDRSYLGGGAVGVEAASQFYFGKSVRKVNLAEAALLAGLFKGPSKFAPHINLPASRARTNTVLTNLVEAGYMTEGQVHAARLNPAKIIETQRANSPDWFLDWAFEQIPRVAGAAATMCSPPAPPSTTMPKTSSTAPRMPIASLARPSSSTFTQELLRTATTRDDFSPMSWNGSGVTGGSLPAMTWHAFMSVATRRHEYSSDPWPASAPERGGSCRGHSWV
jgi:penicillin-binding protein 1A